eukprot:XP_019919475.1 PREDICTED: VWFA and cache domain-containing protein 1 [Crassostrea gigas]
MLLTSLCKTMRVPYLSVCLFIVNQVVLTSAQEINAGILSDELNKVADSVGWSFLQGEYNKLQYKEKNIDGIMLVREIAGKIGGRMIEVNNALKKLKEAVEEDQLSSDYVPQDCCVDGEYKGNLRFRTDVSEDKFCYSKPSYVNQENIRFPSTNLLTVLKTNLDVKHLQFQYIAMNSGLYINYPATKLTDCDTYDPRFRPFYVSTTTSSPRDVVVVIEMSSSMRGDILFEAKHAVLTVMETLDEEDRFGLVVFNDIANTLGGCYENQLVPVTSATKKSFRNFLSSQAGEGGANYINALRKAFLLLKTNYTKTRDQILLFVSAGKNTEGNPLEVIRDENEALQNRVIINTYGIGTGLSTSDQELLKNMAEQTLNNNTYGYVTRGKSKIITDIMTSSLREIMGTYYVDLSVPIATSPTYTQPYIDFFINESIITGCLPVAFNGAFSGVVCADILISELVAEILYLKKEEFSYAFIIDGEERTMLHPLLTDPRGIIMQEQDINNIYNFETSGDVSKVIDSMKKGLESKTSVKTTIIEARGEKLFEGDSKVYLDAVYYWNPIVAPGSNLSLCIVMKQNNTVSNKDVLTRPSDGDFLYHRWDLNQWPAPFCRHFSRYATEAKSTVKLTPDAFIEAYSYTGVKETEVRVKQYKDYLSGAIFTNPGLKASAVNSIRLTYPLEKFWTTTSKKEAPYLAWRYVMTEDGVIRTYPGIRLEDDYNHKLRTWYRRTAAQKSLNVLSAPYEDSWGAGRIISLTKTILQGGTNPDKKLEAVIGTDFSVFYFKQILEDKYPICANKTNYICIVIDNSGFLVMHPFYTETTTPIKAPVHITYKEERISRSLISRTVMYQQPCRDTGNKKEQFTFRVNLPKSVSSGFLDSDEGYEMRPVAGSNVYLILKHRRLQDEETCCTSGPNTSPSSIQCTGVCNCLCYNELFFNECKNKYDTMDGFIPCSPQLPTLRSVSTPEEDKTRNLQTCFSTNCECRKTESECFRISSCSWCTSDKKGYLLKGFCGPKEICPSQQCLKDDCKEKCCGSECQLPSSSNGNQLLYVGVSLGTLVFVILIVVAVFFIVRRLKPDVVDNTYLEPVHTYNTINKTLRESDHYDTIQDFHNEECK